jgi:choline dehydrogenase
VVASRLSENGKYSVMLLEAGGHPSPSSSIPIMVSSLQETPLNWNFTTEPQRNGTKSFNENVSKFHSLG